MKPLCLTHIPIPNRFGSLYCSNCGVWLDDGTAVAPTERAPALETFALPKPEPLRSDYEKNYGRGQCIAIGGVPEFGWEQTTMTEAYGKGMFGYPPETPIQVPRQSQIDWLELARQPWVNEENAVNFAKHLNAAVRQQWRKQDSDLCAHLFEQVLRVARDYCVHALACNVDGYNLTLFTDCGGLAHTALVSVLEPFLPNAAFRVGDYWELP